MSKITILMAVYNAAQYLDESIASVRRQTHTDWQLLCVDDCSTDSSPAILERYATEDSRIRVWHQSHNQGQAVARNLALQYAEGDITMFLDADDWLSDDALALLDEAFRNDEECDTVLFRLRYAEADGSQRDYPQPRFDHLTGYDAFVKSLTWQIHGVYAIRTALHKQHPYDTSCRHYSDDNTTRIHYYISRHVRECAGVYYYRTVATSVTHNVSTSRMDYLKANISMRRQLLELNCSDTIVTLYENHRWLNVIGIAIWYIDNRHAFTASERRYCLAELRKAWASIDTSVLRLSYKLKPGYIPFRHCWPLFWLQTEMLALKRRVINFNF